MDTNAHDRLVEELPISVGYMTGEFDMAERAFNPNMAPDRLLDLLLLADDRKLNDGREPFGDWKRLRNEAGGLLMQRMTGLKDADAHKDWEDRDAVWDARKFRHALKSIPDMADGDLLTLFMQAAENAYLYESEPMQARWEVVTVRCRAEILTRIGASQPSESVGAEEGPATDDSEPDDDDEDFEYVSVREALRVAEEAFQPDIPDAKLLDVYLLVKECGQPDDEDVFDEIIKAATDMVLHRMEAGEPEPEPGRHVPWFEPEEGAKALIAVVRGKLPHKDLLNLYLIALYRSEPYTIGCKWLAIADLCRAQILKRMTLLGEFVDVAWREWKRSELTARVLDHGEPAAVPEKVAVVAGGVS